MSDSRRPGGQPGNTNALKHGFYARKFKPNQLEDYDRARSLTGLDEEIALLRLVILNLAQSCLPVPGSPPDLAACTALEASIARLAHLLKDQRLLSTGIADPADLIAVLFASANAREVPAYGRFVAEQIARFGRHHPLIRTQFFSEELIDTAGMFPPARRALMQGSHLPQSSPLPDHLYAFLLDVGGETFSPTSLSSNLPTTTPSAPFPPSPLGRVVPNSGAGGEGPDAPHDLTALTIVDIVPAPAAAPSNASPLPLYRVVARFGWQGASHADLYPILRQLRDQWHARYFVIDATGLGAGLASFLSKIWSSSECLVIPFTFTARSKSDLGWSFLSLVETNRFQDHTPTTSDEAYQTFWRQLPAVTHILRPDQTLSWGIPAGFLDPLTRDPLHDDWVISASLCSLLDKHISLSQGISIIIPPLDPLANLGW